MPPTIAHLRPSFVAAALDAREDFRRTGYGYDARAVHEYLRARVAGITVEPLKAKRVRSRR